MDTYTITAIDPVSGSVDVTFSVDGKAQNISGLPIDDPDALHQALSAYLVAYKAGLALDAAPANATVPDAVAALIGQPQTVEQESQT